ncbi:hypothetical protein ACJX0J_041167, partial [Zea mays]
MLQIRDWSLIPWFFKTTTFKQDNRPNNSQLLYQETIDGPFPTASTSKTVSLIMGTSSGVSETCMFANSLGRDTLLGISDPFPSLYHLQLKPILLLEMKAINTM